MMCFGAVFFMFLVLRDSGASWICEFIYFIKFVKFWPLFLQYSLAPHLVYVCAMTSLRAMCYKPFGG